MRKQERKGQNMYVYRVNESKIPAIDLNGATCFSMFPSTGSFKFSFHGFFCISLGLCKSLCVSLKFICLTTNFSRVYSWALGPSEVTEE